MSDDARRVHSAIANDVADEAVARAWQVALSSVELAQKVSREREAAAASRAQAIVDRRQAGDAAATAIAVQGALESGRTTVRRAAAGRLLSNSHDKSDTEDVVVGALEKAVFGVAYRLRALAQLTTAVDGTADL